MEKRSPSNSSDELDEQEPVKLTTVRLRLLRDVRLKIDGKVTGNHYYFHGGGSELDVDEKDAEVMLNRPIQKSCCDGYNGSPYFEIVR